MSIRNGLTLTAILAASCALAEEGYEPARFLSGRIPVQPPMASAGGLVVLEIEIAPSGIVTEVLKLDDAPPFTEAVAEELRLWRFRPAKEDGAAVSGRAVVIGLFRPPVLTGSGDPPTPTHLRSAAEEIPYPTKTVTPSYPPTALYDGVALVEAEVGEEGNVRHATLRSSAEAYDALALEACEQFEFRPARHEGRPILSYALVLFGFRQPVTLRKRPGPNP